VLLVPPGVVTLTVLAPIVALGEIVKVAVMVVEFATTRFPTVIPFPDRATVVPVAAKSVPVRVTITAVPRPPELGETETSAGTVGATIVKKTALLDPFTAVLTLTLLVESPAPAAIAKVAVTVVSFTTVKLLTSTPLPVTTIPFVPVKPVPINVTRTLVPCCPVLGAMEVSTGPNTVKVWVLLVPLDVVTLRVLALIVALAEIVKVVVMVVEFTTVKVPIATPGPDIATLVPVGAKFVPVSVTGKAVPRKPVLGAMEASVGGGNT
jgi:hypothetical protein